MAPPSTRARALGLARWLAAGALQRIAREVDRLSLALEPVRGVIPLREPARKVELEVSARAAPRGAVPQATTSASLEPPTPDPPAAAPEEGPSASTAPTVSITPALLQVGHLRDLVDPPLAILRDVAAWEQAEDPVEAVHRVRVATRRLRAFVRLFAPMLGSKRARRLERRLRAITRGLGPVREWDVLLAGLRAQAAHADPLARAAIEHVEAWAQAHRRKAVRRAHAALADEDAVALAEAIDAEVDRVCGRLLRHDDPLPARASALLEPERARALEGMPTPAGETDMDALHDVRIRAKRLRYALELLQPTLREPHGSLRPTLKRVQSTLGEHREAAQLVDRLHDRRAALDAQGLHTLAGALEPVETALLRQRKRAFEHAMRALEDLRTRAEMIRASA